jgi:hypothetical protein
VLFFACISFSGIKAQFVVEDPLNAGINSSIASLSEVSVSLQTFLTNTKVLEMATSGLETMNSVKEIAKLTDDLVCLSSEFNFYMNIKTYYSCAKFLNFRLVDINLKYTTELLTGVVLAKNLFTMTGAERLNNLNKIKDVLEKTIKDMQTINSTIRAATIQNAYRKYIKKAYTPDPKKTMAFNRYQNR